MSIARAEPLSLFPLSLHPLQIAIIFCFLSAERPIRRMTGHTARVGALSWNDAILTSGSHDKSIYHRDVRVHAHFVGKLTAHRQEVCGLKWNEQGDQLASGGNDNRLFVFDKMNEVRSGALSSRLVDGG